MVDQSLIKDRGNIKWTAMMLPEHKEALKGMMEAQKDIIKPELTEEKLEQINEIVSEALNKHNKNLREMIITYYNNRRLHTFEGIIRDYDFTQHALHVFNQEFKWAKTISIQDIVDVEYAE